MQFGKRVKFRGLAYAIVIRVDPQQKPIEHRIRSAYYAIPIATVCGLVVNCQCVKSVFCVARGWVRLWCCRSKQL